VGSSFFCVHLHQSQIGPDALNQIIQIEVLLSADHHRVVLASQFIHLLKADRVNLVVYIYARDVFPSPYQDIDEFIGGYLEDVSKYATASERPRSTHVLSNHHVAIMQLI